MPTRTVLLSCVLLIVPAVLQAQDDAGAACAEAARLIKDNQIDDALEEARWCVEALEQLKQQKTLAVFPDEIDGFIGGEISNQKAMGMSMIARTYTRDGQSMEISLTGGGAATSGLAALAQLGLSMGGETGKKLRIQHRVVLDMSDEDEANFMVQLRSGGMMTLKSTDVDGDRALTFLKAFPIAALDDALSNK